MKEQKHKLTQIQSFEQYLELIRDVHNIYTSTESHSDHDRVWSLRGYSMKEVAETVAAVKAGELYYSKQLPEPLTKAEFLDCIEAGTELAGSSRKDRLIVSGIDRECTIGSVLADFKLRKYYRKADVTE